MNSFEEPRPRVRNSQRIFTKKLTQLDPTLQGFIKNYSEYINEYILGQEIGYIFTVSELCGLDYESIPDHKALEIYLKEAVEKGSFPKISFQGRCSTRNRNLYKRIA